MFIAILNLIQRKSDTQYSDPVLNALSEVEALVKENVRVDITTTAMYYEYSFGGINGVAILDEENRTICVAAHDIATIDDIYEQIGYQFVRPRSKKNTRKLKQSIDNPR